MHTWYLIVTLFSSSDVLLGEQKNLAECVKTVENFKKQHKNDKDIKEVTCRQGTVITDYVGEFEEDK